MKLRVIILLVLVAVAAGTIVVSTSINHPSSSVNGLEFTLVLNASSIQWGENLTVSLNLFNTLGRANNVSGVQAWRLTNQSECVEQCGTVGEFNCAQNDVFRIEVISGYYDLNNFSKGTPLHIFPLQSTFGPNECNFYIRAANSSAPPISVPYSTNYYIFSPQE